MTKFEQEIYEVIQNAPWADEENCSDDYEEYARVAANVAKKYIEKAWKDRIIIYFEQDEHKTNTGRFEQWLKENGITE